MADTKKLRLGSVTIAYCVMVIAFFTIQAVLQAASIEYRLWLSTLGYIVILTAPMIIIFLWIKLAFFTMIQQLQEKELSTKNYRTAQVFVYVLYVIICVVVLFFAGLFGVFTMHEERITDEGTLQVMYGGFPNESYWYDYDKISFWGRRQAAGLKELNMLEHKYGCEFTVDDRGFDIGKIFYIPKSNPDLSVSFYGGYNGEVLVDDYAQQYLSALFHEGMNQYQLESESGSIYFDEPYMEFYLCMEDSQENRKRLADDAATLITYVLERLEQDADAPCDGGVLHIAVLQNVNGQYDMEKNSIKLPFGNTKKTEFAGREGDYYTSAERVYQAMQEQIPIIEESYQENDAYEEDETPVQSSEPSWESEIEELAKYIYDKELADSENHFEMTYNARGNPYAILGEGQKQLKTGKLVQTRRTLVYDRTSQNGKCELFVYYEEKYDLEGNPLDNTAILNMYAIDKESHDVYPSGRHAWEDVGDAAYREATGE